MIYGLTVRKTTEVVTDEPIALSEVKDYLDINFASHDAKLSRLIVSCRESLEQFKSVTLIDERSVSVSWQTFVGDATLPYYPLKSGTSVTVTDLEGTEIEATEYTILDSEGSLTFIGSFPDGVKLSYTTAKQFITDNVKELLIRAVADAFTDKITPMKAVQNQFMYVEVY